MQHMHLGSWSQKPTLAISTVFCFQGEHFYERGRLSTAGWGKDIWCLNHWQTEGCRQSVETIQIRQDLSEKP